MRARALGESSTDAERLLWSRLRDRRLGGHKFRRQHPVGPFFADFACLERKVVVELDGGQHYDATTQARDARRTAALERAGFQVVRFSNLEVLSQLDAVLARIVDRLGAGDPHPSPLPQAGEGEMQKEAP